MYAGAMTDARPYAHPADDAEDDQGRQVRGEAGAERAEQEEDRGHLHGGQSSVPVRDAAGEDRARSRAEQCRGDGEAQTGGADLEAVLDSGDRAVDHGAVVAEQEPAQRRDGGDANRNVPVFLLSIDRRLVGEATVFAHPDPFRNLSMPPHWCGERSVEPRITDPCPCVCVAWTVAATSLADP
jgi:hypothetical protein